MRSVLLALAAAVLAAAAHAGEPLPSAAAVAEPQPARDISALAMTDDQGTPVTLAASRGKLVVLNLWAPWCVPCRSEMPELATVQSRLAAEGVAVLPLAFTWQGRQAVTRFYAEENITNLPVLVGDGQNLQDVTGLSALPTTLILNRKGEHVATVRGGARWSDDRTLAWLQGLAQP